MAKRFTDSGKWKKKWFRKLPSHMKLLWIYLCDNCDHAGIFEVDFERISFDMGVEFREESVAELIECFQDRIEEFNQGEKWFLRGFLDFQYGPFNEKNRVHISANNILIKYNLTWNKESDIKPLISPLQGAKDKDTDKAKDKDEDRGIVKGGNIRTDFYKNWLIERCLKQVEDLYLQHRDKFNSMDAYKSELDKWDSYYESKSAEFKSDSALFASWKSWIMRHKKAIIRPGQKGKLNIQN